MTSPSSDDHQRLAAAEAALADDEGAVVVSAPTEWDVVRVEGPDAADYLHGQLSQNIERLAVGGSAWTFLLQPQGKVDAWGRIVRVDEEAFAFVVDPGHGPTVESRLQRFKLRVDAEISTATVAGLALRGRGTRSAVADGSIDDGAVVVVDADWGGEVGVDLLPAAGSAGLDVAGDGWLEAPTELLTILRCRGGRPAMGHELDDSTIPAAARVVNRSVDFTKGCYVGQELVARVDSRGQNTPTRLCRLSLVSGSAPDIGDELTVSDPETTAEKNVEVVAGTVTTMVNSPTWGSIGLGYVRRKVETPASLGAGAGTILSAEEVEDIVISAV